MSEKLLLARKYLLEEKDQLALDTYLELHKEDDKNEEASYFVYNAYCTQAVDEQAASSKMVPAYRAVTESLVELAKALPRLEGENKDKLTMMMRAIGSYAPIAAYAVNVNIGLAPQVRIELAAVSLYEVGDAIDAVYGGDSDGQAVAAFAWKEAVRIATKFYAFKYDGHDRLAYVEKIKKYQPDYEAPKKPGCISVG